MDSLLIIYTGGTIGMKENPETGALAPFDFGQIVEEVPELQSFHCRLDSVSLPPLVDSSDVTPDFWERLARLIAEKYDQYDGFVVLHGTDTMAYTASALSFMLRGLGKPVVLTGSQLPIGALRTDGKENLLCALEIAMAKGRDGLPVVPEVSVFFDHSLMRGNRTTKFGAERFDAFRSFNYPHLAEVGIHVRYNTRCVRSAVLGTEFQISGKFEKNVASLKLFPGIPPQVVRSVLAIPDLRGLLLETYGAGNAPSAPWFLDMIAEAIGRGLTVVNISQCPADSISMTSYDAGLGLARMGVVSGRDTTFEAAVVKLMLALGEASSPESVRAYFLSDLAGEMGESIAD